VWSETWSDLRTAGCLPPRSWPACPPTASHGRCRGQEPDRKGQAAGSAGTQAEECNLEITPYGGRPIGLSYRQHVRPKVPKPRRGTAEPQPGPACSPACQSFLGQPDGIRGSPFTFSEGGPLLLFPRRARAAPGNRTLARGILTSAKEAKRSPDRAPRPPRQGSHSRTLCGVDLPQRLEMGAAPLRPAGATPDSLSPLLRCRQECRFRPTSKGVISPNVGVPSELMTSRP
jgi:hypothetical protein